MGSTVIVLTGLRHTSSLIECKTDKQAESVVSKSFSSDVVVSIVDYGKSWSCYGDDEWRLKSETLNQNVAAAILMFALEENMNALLFGTFVFKFTGKTMRAKARNWISVYQNEEEFEKVDDMDSDQAFKDMFHQPVSIRHDTCVEASGHKRKRIGAQDSKDT